MTLEQVCNTADNKNFNEMKLIYDGSSEMNSNPRSHVYRLDTYCIKYYIRSKTDYYTEYTNLRKLEPFGFAPKLYFGSEEQQYIIMEFIDGTPLGELKTQLTNGQKQALE